MKIVKLNGKDYKELNPLAKEIFKTFSITKIKGKLCNLKFREGIEYSNYADNMKVYTKKELSLILAERMLLQEVIGC